MRRRKLLHWKDAARLLLSPGIDLAARLPSSYVRWLDKSALRTGWQNADALCHLLAIKFYLPLALLLLSLRYKSAWLFLSPFIFFMPDLVVGCVLSMRQRFLLEQLPDFLDHLALHTSAGMALEAALRQYALQRASNNYVLKDEIDILNRNLAYCMSRKQAYEALFDRTGLHQFKTLGEVLYQCVQEKTNIAVAVRDQSKLVRADAIERAERSTSRWMACFALFALSFVCISAWLLH